MAIDPHFLVQTQNHPWTEAKRKTTTTINHYRNKKEKAKKEEKNYNISRLSLYRYEILNKKKSIEYQVDFNDKNAICSCPNYQEIILSAQNNFVCKHIALIMLNCDENESYKGNRKFTNEEYGIITEILNKFKTKNEKEKNNEKEKI